MTSPPTSLWMRTLKKYTLLNHEANIELEENPFTSSLNICPEACSRKGWYGRINTTPSPPPPRATTLFRSWSVDVAFKDDVTVILLHGFIQCFGTGSEKGGRVLDHGLINYKTSRVSDPHWFNADPDPAFFLIADPDSGSGSRGSGSRVWWPKIEKNL